MSEQLAFCEIVSYKLKNIDHHKHCICIDPVQKFFLFINSNPTRSNPTGDMEIQPIGEFNFLKHKSYVNTSALERIYQYDLECPGEKRGKLSNQNIEILGLILFNNKTIRIQDKKQFWKQLEDGLKERLKEFEPKRQPIPTP